MEKPLAPVAGPLPESVPPSPPDRPFGRKRWEATHKTLYYTHVEASKALGALVRRSGLPRYLWTRVVTSFCNQYGLTLWNSALYVQEDLVPAPTGEGYVKAGIPEDVQDYLAALDPVTLAETEAGKDLFISKWQARAEELQLKHNVPKALIAQLASDEFDAAGYRRTSPGDNGPAGASPASPGGA